MRHKLLMFIVNNYETKLLHIKCKQNYKINKTQITNIDLI